MTTSKKIKDDNINLYILEGNSDLDDTSDSDNNSANESETIEISIEELDDIEKNLKETKNTKETKNKKIIYKKLSYKQVETKIDKSYFNKNHRYSNSLDILASYLKGQKLIYMESKSYCETRLNSLMMPSILLSTAATVLASIIKDYIWGAYLIAGINGIIAFLLAVVNYLKLDAASEAHKTSAHQYDKLQTTVEFMSGKTLLFSHDSSSNYISNIIG